jgi:hypothetical protein
MKFGLIPVNVGVKSVAQCIGLAQLAEPAGFESAQAPASTNWPKTSSAKPEAASAS